MFILFKMGTAPLIALTTQATISGTGGSVTFNSGLLGIDSSWLSTTTLIDESSESTKLRMNFADDSHLDTDMIVFSAGIRPYDQLAKKADIEVGPRGGIIVDYHCRTSDSDIFAIGECALFGGMIYGLVAPGYRMAEVAVQQFSDLEEKPSFQGADMSTKLKLLGVDVGSIGDAHGKAEGSISYVFSDEKEEVYKHGFCWNRTNHVEG